MTPVTRNVNYSVWYYSTCIRAAAYHTCLLILCFEVQRALHRIVHSHGNKRGTIGSRSTSAVILTKYSAVLKCSEARL